MRPPEWRVWSAPCADCGVLDIRMPDVDGLTVLRQVRELPEAPIVAMLTTFDTDEYIVTVLRSGAAGFLLKDTEPDQLPQLIRSLAAGEVVMSRRRRGPCCGATPWRAWPAAMPRRRGWGG